MIEGDLKRLCEAFDASFELEGGQHKKHVDKLLGELAIAFEESKSECNCYTEWIAYMYGTLAVGITGDEEIMSLYKQIKNVKNEYIRETISKHKVFDLYTIVKSDM